MKIFLICLGIYIVSVIIILIDCYRDFKYCIKNVGDLLDISPSFTYIPIFNTFVIIMLLLAIILDCIFRLLRIYELWDKIRNIKL